MANERTYISELDGLMKDWHWEKNNAEGIYPDKISTGSDKYAWWKCHICGYEELKRCNNRFYGHGCTRCSREINGKKHKQSFINKNGSLADLYPELAKELHPSKNIDVMPHTVNKGTKLKAWWICPNGHEYQSTIANRVHGNSCPYCSGKKVLAGFNDLATTNPDIAKSWDTDNNMLLPTQITAGSHKNVWWKCSKGHSYRIPVFRRTSGGDCPICRGKQVLVGYNDLKSQLPEVALDWDYDKNGDLKPEDVTVGCGKKVWWKCHTCGYEWNQYVYTRQKCGCPACTNRVLFRGYNDLRTRYPELAKQWHPNLNIPFTPNDIIDGSNSSFWWKCNICGCEWKTSLNARIRGRGCPDCGKVNRGKSRVAATINRVGPLSITHPDLVKEWNYERNIDISPNDISHGSNRSVWWKCKRGHEWKASIYSRVAGRGCKKCNDEFHSSFPEQAVYFYLSQITEAQNRARVYKREIDVYLPNLSIGIEYNGKFYHARRKANDKEKQKYLAQHGIRIITIEESDVFGVDNDTIKYPVDKNYTCLDKAIYSICEILSLTRPEVDISRDYSKIYGQYLYQEKLNSLAIVCPFVAKEWDYEKNFPVTPEMVSYGSNKVFWWKCKNGHEWQSPVGFRANRKGGYPCPFCSGHFLEESIRDERKESILELLRNNPTSTQAEIAGCLGLSEHQVFNAFKELQAEGRITRKGTNFNGQWIVK